MEKGYACVGLHKPQSQINVGSAMRAVGVYGAKFLVCSGRHFGTQPTDVMHYYKDIPFIRVKDLHDAIPYDCVPVAVDIVEGAVDLFSYVHPDRAFYVFGPENGTLGNKTLNWYRDRVYVPTNDCMNLAAAVNVVLYDRSAKQC